MKVRINLYQEPFVPKVVLLSLKSVVASSALLAAVMLIAGGSLAWSNATAEKKVQLLEGTNESLSGNVEKMRQALDDRVPNPVLVAAIDSQKLAVGQRQKLLAELSMRERNQSTRFATTLSDLDRADTDKVWLQRIYLSGGDVTIDGLSVRADAIPKWLQNLRYTQSFKGQDFTQANMQKVEQGISFTLQAGVSAPTTQNGQVSNSNVIRQSIRGQNP